MKAKLSWWMKEGFLSCEILGSKSFVEGIVLLRRDMKLLPITRQVVLCDHGETSGSASHSRRMMT
jgi:hypothetical protein